MLKELTLTQATALCHVYEVNVLMSSLPPPPNHIPPFQPWLYFLSFVVRLSKRQIIFSVPQFPSSLTHLKKMLPTSRTCSCQRHQVVHTLVFLSSSQHQSSRHLHIFFLDINALPSSLTRIPPGGLLHLIGHPVFSRV